MLPPHSVSVLIILFYPQALEFEHRDMHRGNVLVRRTHEKYHYFRLNNKEYYIESHGVQATIVDYTLSRVKQGVCVWTDGGRGASKCVFF